MTTNNNQLNVVFRTHVVDDENATRLKGRPMFTEMEVCDISFPGNSKTKATFPAHEAEPNATREAAKEGGGVVTYAMLYNGQYQAFKAGKAQPLSGTSLSEAPFLTEAKRRELQALGVKTVEQLAEIDGTPLKQLGMGGRELKNQAKTYLKNATGSADIVSLAAQVESLREQLEEERRLRMEALSGEVVPVDPQPPVPIDPEDEVQEPMQATGPELDAMDENQLKTFIASHTGERPKGNPKLATLLAAAKELAGIE